MPFERIIRAEKGDAEFWITDEDGSKVSMKAYQDNLLNNPTFKKMFDGWVKQKIADNRYAW